MTRRSHKLITWNILPSPPGHTTPAPPFPRSQLRQMSCPKSQNPTTELCVWGGGGGWGWQWLLILPLSGFPWSPQLRNLSIMQRARAKRAEIKFVFPAIRQCEMNSLLVLLVVSFFAVTNCFFRGNVELTFPFLQDFRITPYIHYACPTFWLTSPR